MKDERKTKSINFLGYLGDILFAIVVIPIVLMSMMIIYKSIRYPDKIPDIFSYKPFIVLDSAMDDSIEYGDLVITQIVDTDKLQKGDLIAFRNSQNFVTLHRIAEITKEDELKTFKMQTRATETNITKSTTEENVEGIFVKRYPNVGIWLLLMQDPFALLFIISIVLIIGLIAYYFAERLDNKEKEERLSLKEKESEKENTIEKKTRTTRKSTDSGNKIEKRKSTTKKDSNGKSSTSVKGKAKTATTKSGSKSKTI